MKKNLFLIWLVLVLLAISIGLYIVFSLIFGNMRATNENLASAAIFLPIQLIIVVVIVDRLIENRDKQIKLDKLNVVAGVFFSELGERMLTSFNCAARDRDRLFRALGIKASWTLKEFKAADAFSKGISNEINVHQVDLEAIKVLLQENRPFLVLLLENPTLLEHDGFTDMVLSILHLADELIARNSLNNLPKNDINHIEVDINRAYSSTVAEWLEYMRHIKSDYPFLYSLYVRIHPFQENPSAIIS